MRSGGGGESLGQIAVLGRVGNPVQWAEEFTRGPPAIRGGRLGHSVVVEHDDRVQHGTAAVVGRDPAQIGLHQLHTGDAAVLQRAADVGDARLGDLERTHGYLLAGIISRARHAGPGISVATRGGGRSH